MFKVSDITHLLLKSNIEMIIYQVNKKKLSIEIFDNYAHKQKNIYIFFDDLSSMSSMKVS